MRYLRGPYWYRDVLRVEKSLFLERIQNIKLKFKYKILKRGNCSSLSSLSDEERDQLIF